MYKFMNLWKIEFIWKRWRFFYSGYPVKKFFKPDTQKLSQESFVSFIVVQARQVNKLLPIGHRWRGDVECVS
jgi:hypothetical protein